MRIPVPTSGDDIDWDEPKNEPIDAERVLKFLRRRRKVMLLTALALSPLLALLPLLTDPVYQAAATVVVPTVVVQLPPEVTEFGADFMPESAGRISPLARAAAIVNSGRVLGPVIDRMAAPKPEEPGLLERILGTDDEDRALSPSVTRAVRIGQLRQSIEVTFKGGNTILKIAARAGKPGRLLCHLRARRAPDGLGFRRPLAEREGRRPARDHPQQGTDSRRPQAGPQRRRLGR